jgi:hypothetical protein
MVALRDLVKTPLYINAKISIRPMWEDMFNIAKTQQSKNHLNTLQENELNMEQNSNKFEKMIEKLATNTLVQNFLSPNQIINDENIIITMALGQDYKPLRLFQDQSNKECNYFTLFFGMSQKPSILAKFQYQDIVQWELMHKDHQFAKHIQNLFFKVIKVLIQ